MSPLEINVKTANFVLIYNKSDGKCPLIAHFFLYVSMEELRWLNFKPEYFLICKQIVLYRFIDKILLINNQVTFSFSLKSLKQNFTLSELHVFPPFSLKNLKSEEKNFFPKMPCFFPQPKKIMFFPPPLGGDNL